MYTKMIKQVPYDILVNINIAKQKDKSHDQNCYRTFSSLSDRKRLSLNNASLSEVTYIKYSRHSKRIVRTYTTNSYVK